VAIYHSDGIHVNGPNTRFAGYDIDWIEGEGEMDYVVESLPLLEGSYDFSASIYDYDCTHAYDHQQRAYRFLVTYGAAVRERYGLVYIPSCWEHRRL
jgi:lipopolysaccharide transport system ATP-binding protein